MAKSRKTVTVPNVNSIQTKFAVMREDMNKGLIEREGEVDVVLTAMIAREHPLFVGPPGTAKSMMLDGLLKWMGPGSKKFSIQFNKYTTPEEVFGPISVTGLKEDQYRRVTTNRLPEAHVGYGDEIGKAGSAILNSLLLILNERQYLNGDGQYHKVPLQIFVAASNEWPSGEELGALFDRFLFRKTVKPISKSGRDRLLWTKDLDCKVLTHITPEEIDQAHQEARALDWEPDAKISLREIIDELNREGISPGDRRMRKSVMATQAYAYLNGAQAVEKEHLEILAHVLWDDPTEQPDKCFKVVTKIANPTAMAINDLMIQAVDIINKTDPNSAVPRLQELQRKVAQLEQNVRVIQFGKYLETEVDKMYKRVLQGGR